MDLIFNADLESNLSNYNTAGQLILTEQNNIYLVKSDLTKMKFTDVFFVSSLPSNGQLQNKLYITSDFKINIWDGSNWNNLNNSLTGEQIISLINASSSTIDDNNLSINVNDAINKKHSHSNQSTLDATTASYTAEEKNKLSGIENNANDYIHPSGDGNLHVPATGITNNGKVLIAGSTAGSLSWGTLTKSDVGLGNVDNTADSNKSVLSATKFTTPRNINLTGDTTGTASFDGSVDVSISTTLKNVGTSGVQKPKVTTDAQGRVTSSTDLVASDIPSLTHDKISDFDTGVQSNRLDQLTAPISDVSLNSHKITNLATPTVSTDGATKGYVDSILGANDAMVFKGVLDCSTNPNYPSGNTGETYKVSVAGKIGGASGINVEVGDMLICLADNSASGTQATVGANWNIIQTNIDGQVIGSASSTDHAIVRFNGTSGKSIQNSTVTIDDNGSINVPSGQSYKINNVDINTAGTLTNVVYNSTNQTIAGTKTFSGTVNMSALTASQTLELDASKNIVGVAKGTAYNVNFETTATNIKMDGAQSLGSLGTVARADHVHPTDTSKAPLNSPALTGTPTAPTPTTADNSTQIATTAFVKAQGYITSSQAGTIITVSSTQPTGSKTGDIWIQTF